MTKSYENRKSSTNSKRPESISNILSSAVKNPICTVDDPPVCPTTQKWHLWSFSCHQDNFTICHIVTLYCVLFFSLFVQSPPRQPWRRRWHPGSYWCPSPPTPDFWFCDVRRRQTFKNTDENRHYFSFQTETWENRRPWDLPQHRPWLGLLQRHQGSYRALHSPSWMMIHFYAELVKGGEGDLTNPKLFLGQKFCPQVNSNTILSPFQILFWYTFIRIVHLIPFDAAHYFYSFGEICQGLSLRT